MAQGARSQCNSDMWLILKFFTKQNILVLFNKEIILYIVNLCFTKFFKRLLMFPKLEKKFQDLRDVHFRYGIHKTYPKVY